MSNEIMAMQSNNQQTLPSTITMESAHDKNRALRALNASESLAEAVQVGQPFDVVDIFQTPGLRRSRIEGVNDTPCVNTYFLLTDGRSLMSQSDGIARSVNMLLSPVMYPDCGRSTEKGFLTLAVTERKLSNGNTIKSVVPLD